jgi:zinc protease
MIARPALFAAALACGLAAQSKPALTAEQIIEKSLEASGGRAAMSKLTSTYASGSIEFVTTHMRGQMEMYAKAPNKQLVISKLEGVGEVRQGFDGEVAWGQDPSGAVEKVTDDALDDVRRSAVFNAALKWRELYPKVELVGEEAVGGRPAWVVRLTPATGKPEKHYFDQQTFMLVKEAGTRDIPKQGAVEISVELSDYREIGGIKVPFRIKQAMVPLGDMIITLSEVKNNIAIDDAQFAMPAAKP